MSFVCFIQAAEYGIANLFLSSHLRVSIGDVWLPANKGVFVSLPCEMRAYIFKRGLLRMSRSCTMDLLAAILAVARAGVINWAVPDCLG